MPDTPHISDEREQLEEEAVRWIVRLTSGETTADDRAAAARWRKQSRSHEEAFHKAERLWQGLSPIRERLIDLDRHPASASRPAPQRERRLGTSRRLVATVTMVVALALTFVFRADLLLPLRADHRTGTGERVVVTLPDGSLAHLNTNSAIAVQYGDDERRIALLGGEVDFAVTKDHARPFIVEAGGGKARAVGTEFIVRDRTDSISVAVVEGVVTASYSFRGQEQSTRLEAAEQLQYGPEFGLSAVEPADIPRAAAWRRGKLMFESAPLAQAVAEINRHRRGRILLLNSALARHRVSGVFDLNRLDEAVQTIELSLNLHTIHLTSHIAVWY